MRLIDADALIQWLDVGHLRSPSELCYSELDVKHIIDAAPTLDVQPVRRGEWKDDKLDVYWHNSFIHKRCSECGAEPHKNRDYTGRIVGYITSHFCHNCGADMRSLRNRINGEIAGGDEE